jgi:peptidoglycan pentaglycine glycine transferase (the first glycine)
MQIREAAESDRDIFNGFVARFPSGDLLQSWEWGDLKARSGWKPVRLLGEEGGQVVAAASLLKRSLPKVGRSILYASRGPVLDTQNAGLVQEFTVGMADTARRHGGILLKIDPPIELQDTASESSLRAAGFQPIAAGGFGGTQPKAVMQLDLAGRSLDEIMASFHQKWRYNIRLAEKRGVVVRTDGGRAEIPAFYKLLKETTERDGFLVRSQRYFEDMWDLLDPPGYVKLALTYYEEKPVAGALCFLFGDKAWYTYGASSNEHRNVMPNHLMQWRMIQWAKENDCRWYDFRGVSPKKGDGSDAHLEGLNRFKEGFSPRFVEYIGEYDLPLSPTWYWAWNVARPRIQTMLKARRKAEAVSRPTADV